MNEMSQTPSQAPLFLRIPIWRLIFLSILSFGLYEVYWIYRNWKYVGERDGLKIKAFWRGVFGVLFIHTLLQRIHDDKEANALVAPTFSASVLASGWIALIIAAGVIGRLPGTAATVATAFVPSFLCFVPVQNYVNAVEEKRDPAGGYYRWSAGHIVCIVFGLIVWALILLVMLAAAL